MPAGAGARLLARRPKVNPRAHYEASIRDDEDLETAIRYGHRAFHPRWHIADDELVRETGIRHGVPVVVVVGGVVVATGFATIGPSTSSRSDLTDGKKRRNKEDSMSTPKKKSHAKSKSTKTPAKKRASAKRPPKKPAKKG